MKLARPSRGRPRRFCSAAHRQRAYEKRRTPKPVALLRQDIKEMSRRFEMRREIVTVLFEVNMIDLETRDRLLSYGPPHLKVLP